MKKVDMDGEILAAITAALASINARPGYKLIVRSYRRTSTTSPVWNSAGRIEQLEKKLNS